MNRRKAFVDHVRSGGKPICSPQIGAGAGFDVRLSGKEWVSSKTVEDTLAVVQQFDILPLINVGLFDFGLIKPELAWRKVSEEAETDRVTRLYELATPKGTLVKKDIEQKIQGNTTVKYPVQGPEELDAMEWYVDSAIDGDYSGVVEHVRRVSNLVGQIGALSFQWTAQPYEMLCFPNWVDTVMLAMDRPEQFSRLMDKIFLLDLKLMKACADGGADFVFLGSPATEMISPQYYTDYIIPHSRNLSAEAHKMGLLIYTHICSPIEPFLTMGFYNQMGLDLFETLSPPPMGNVKSLADALSKLDPAICTRGNIGLDVLLNGTAEMVREKTIEVCRQAVGRKHVVAASDYLFYNIPEANVHAMAAAVREFNG